MTKRAKVVAGIVAMVVVGWILVMQDQWIGDLADELARFRKGATEARADANRAEVDAHSLQLRLDDRTERFRLMSFACVRLINEYVVRAERLGYAVNAYVFDGQSFEWLSDYWYGEARSYADNVFFLNKDRAGCGMKLDKPNRFPDADVTPVASDWRNGAEQPPF